jgi:hypothetical protein
VEEYDTIIDIIKHIQIPTGYESSFLYKFTEKRQIVGMKTHDYHNLLHDILPIAIGGTLDKDIGSIIYRLGDLFRWLCGQTRYSKKRGRCYSAIVRHRVPSSTQHMGHPVSSNSTPC